MLAAQLACGNATNLQKTSINTIYIGLDGGVGTPSL